MKKYYKIAGIPILIDIPDDKMFTDERTLGEFAVSNCEDPHEFVFSVVEELSPACGRELSIQPSFRVYEKGISQLRYIGSVQNSWEDAYIKAEHTGKKHFIELKKAQFPDKIGVHTVLNCLMMEHLAAHCDGFVFHTSFIEFENKAILFTAPSGTGKSTQADLWNKLRSAEIINGDRCIVRVTENKAYAEGIPFAGSSKYCKNRTLPIAAVVYLQQADSTTIRQLKGVEAFKKIWEGVSVNTWDKEDMTLVSAAVMKLISCTPVFHLACTPDESAIEVLERKL